MVLARSCALTPVVTPKRSSASMVIVNAVRNSSVFISLCCGRSSWSARSPVSARQIHPPALRIMKLMSSGVTSCAEQIRSPSFSRSSSSATMISLPALMSAMACSTVPNSIYTLMLQREIRHGIYRGCLTQVGLEEPAQVFGDYVSLYVDPASNPQIAQRRMTQGVIDQRKLQTSRLQLVHGEANAVNGDRAVQDKERLDCSWERKIDEDCVAREVTRGDDAYTVDVSLHDVPTEPVARANGPLEIHACCRLPLTDRCSLEGSEIGRRVEPIWAE